ncbi:MAG TPA: TIGR04372 family glycosyltransferase [Micropepsaceae bacterium]|nr:TIGR04372 family glycosyltransferase [Micropepsaceae bacterium]
MTRESGAASINRYVGAVRRATYAAEFAKKNPAAHSFLRALKRFTVERVRFAKPVLRPLARVYYGLASWLASAAFIHRHVIRIGVRYIVPHDPALLRFVPRTALIRLSRRLIDLRIPGVSGLTRRIVLTTLMFGLGSQMAAGHIGRTLILARIINLAFRPYIRARRLPVSFFYFQALFHSRQYHRIIADVSRQEYISHHYLNHILGVAHLYSGRPEIAVYYFKRAISMNDKHAPDYRMLGRAYLRLGDEAQAARWFGTAVNLAPNTVMAHQNYAGRYDIPNYQPKAWELEEAESLSIYDNYGQLAEDLFLLGRFDESFQQYQKMLDYQDRVRRPLPADLVSRLIALDSRIDPRKPMRLLPYEWVTQFGHIGLLDSYVKMTELGMFPPANRILLAPAEKVSNRDYLAYWDRYFTIVRDPELVDDLFPYQRMIGDNFMAYPGAAGTAEPWTRAAARAHIGWARQGRAPLLKVSDEDMALGAKTLAALGVPEGAWYVGLHVREGGYYGESSGGMSTHRNAAVDDYLPAIRAVTERGGYVIRLGDSSMQPLPDMERVVDYAHSPEKSSAVDIFFCATSRFVIGTTSGLTTACLSFGTPMILVNCISNDWQLWSGDTDFIVKPVWNLREKRHLTFAETYAQPTQGYLINADVMRRHGLEAVPNSAEEIEVAVRYKLDLMDGLTTRPGDDQEPMRSYRTAMADNSMMFGAAHPVPRFLEQYRKELLLTAESVELTRTDSIAVD